MVLGELSNFSASLIIVPTRPSERSLIESRDFISSENSFHSKASS